MYLSRKKKVTPSTTSTAAKKSNDCGGSNSASTTLDSVVVVVVDDEDADNNVAWKPSGDDSMSVSASTTTLSSQCTVIGSETLIAVPGNRDAGQSSIKTASSTTIATIGTGSSGMIGRSEVRRSKSKVRSYLRKCKDALIGGGGGGGAQQQQNAGEPITHHEAVSQCATATSSWYLDELDDCHVDEAAAVIVTVVAVNVDASDEDAAAVAVDGNDKLTLTDISASKVSQVSDGDAEIQPIDDNNEAGSTQLMIEHSTTTTSTTITDAAADAADAVDIEKLTAPSDSHESETNCGVANLVDRYLGPLYPDYASHTRPVLVRQARDLLVCTFHGNLQRFEEEFLCPAAGIVARIKRSHRRHRETMVVEDGGFNDINSDDKNIETNLLWPNGWPLSVSGAVVLHLGALDESLLRPHDLYICAKAEPSNDPTTAVSVQLCAVWRRASPGLNVVYHQLDPDRAPLSPIALEMLAEELPQLLQSLLVGVEHAINRVPLDELTLFHGTSGGQRNATDHTSSSSSSFIDDRLSSAQSKLILSPLGSPKCGLKRRELINKNKLSNKYAQKRMSGKGGECERTTQKCPPIDATVIPSVSCTETTTCTTPEPVCMLPLFCLGRSFPHIDSDEESGDDTIKTEIEARLPHDIVAPRSIQDLPEKLLTSGIYLPGTLDVNGASIITIEAEKLVNSGVNCYEIATVLLYYSTIPINATFTIHTIATNASQLTVLDLLDHSLQLLHRNVSVHLVLLSCMFKTEKPNDHNLPSSNAKVVYLASTVELVKFMAPSHVPATCGGPQTHSQSHWVEYFTLLESLKSQCLAAGRRLVSVMGEIRASDSQGIPSRRQLYAQHRALSRALMDPDLQNLRRHGHNNLLRVKQVAGSINDAPADGLHDDNTATANVGQIKSLAGDPVSARMCEVITIFDEVDRAARRLEQLTEQRRERLRELTRQRTLEDEMNEVSAWVRSDGETTLTKFTDIALECAASIKEHELEFEKFYFISMKHLAKGQDLQDASVDTESLKATAIQLKEQLGSFGERLENTRERIEGAARLHHLLGLHLKEDDVQHEMQKLAEKIGVAGLVERCKENIAATAAAAAAAAAAVAKAASSSLISKISATSTPTTTTTGGQRQRHSHSGPIAKEKLEENGHCECWRNGSMVSDRSASLPRSLVGPVNRTAVTTTGTGERSSMAKLDRRVTSDEDDEEEHSKMADSGLGYCDRCEGNDKLIRTCSCQSFEDPTNASSKSNNSDDLEEDCFEGNLKQMLDYQSPLQPNAHLYNYSSTLDLPELDNNNGLDPKTQKTLLFIMREMIGTERDYVRSLHYIIENYTAELNREDIPQAMRGQRNVIFGNVEKICEFHQQHFLHELERCEHNPLKVGAAFLEHESKFYLYALYNKNKPKSDSLMSEYGTSFFKTKQLELDDKMDLASYLLKPVQRMGKYALLLQQLMKAVTSVQGPSLQKISEDIEELQRAEEMVRFQLRHGNDLLAMDSLRDCDVNVKEQGRLLRQNEFLVWQGRGGKKTLRQVFLFEELVLFSKARRFPDRKNLDIYLYKNSIKTADIGLTAHTGDSPTKFEIWFRKRKPDDTWTLQSISEDVKNAWTEEVSKLLWKQAKRNREVRLAEMSSMGIGNKPCLDIRPSQNQINDRSITFSQLEKAPKFRNSFSGTLPEVKATRRPNSIISLGSSFSSGTSSSSMSTSTSASSSGSHSARNGTAANMGLELINEMTPLHTSMRGKHQRSTTLVSQLSMESGIIADISISPDTDTHDPQMWPTCITKTSTSSSLSTTSSSASTSSSSSSALPPPPHTNTIVDQKLSIDTTHVKPTLGQPDDNINHSPDPYITNDSITVHL